MFKNQIFIGFAILLDSSLRFSARAAVSKKRRNGGELLTAVSDLTTPVIETSILHVDSDVLNHYVNHF